MTEKEAIMWVKELRQCYFYTFILMLMMIVAVVVGLVIARSGQKIPQQNQVQSIKQ
jgi:uncharacterized membrane-anchored protein YhcB (DUF1043 family)